MIKDFISNLFDDSFMPHAQCFLWYPEIIWMHVISDLFISIAYFSIPLTLLYILRKREDIPFKWVFAMFSAFICLCGITHIFSIVVLWKPIYRLEGLLKILTAGASVATAFLIWPIVPRILALTDQLPKKEKK